jgi:thiopurine S-methyltransferase
MQAQFWLQRWREGRIGFHRDSPIPLLVRHWSAMSLSPGRRVLVPLCGKSLDMVWLAEHGCRVLGVELSPLAVEQFFSENNLEAEQHESAMGVHHVAGNIEIIQGDALELDDATIASCDAIYDRAAMIALPPPLRGDYADKVYARLPAHCRGLLITLEYPQAQMDGPPFSIAAADIDALIGDTWDVDRLERRDILAGQPGFRDDGITSLHTSVYRLTR